MGCQSLRLFRRFSPLGSYAKKWLNKRKELSTGITDHHVILHIKHCNSPLIISGRSHQLRVHCLSKGHRIIGDYCYSNRTDVKPYRMMLHAYRLVIPMKRETIDVTAPDPFLSDVDSLWNCVTCLNTYSAFLLEHPIHYGKESKDVAKNRKPKSSSDCDDLKCHTTSIKDTQKVQL